MASFRPSFPLIARVYPMDGSFTQHVINHNRTRYREAFPIQPLNATPPNTRFGQYANLPYLQLSFDNPPRHSQGFLFGHSRSICDVVLDEELGLRDVHFMVGFTKDYDDGLYRLVVRDLGSSTGTMVTYGARATDFRQDFTWTISGYGFVDESEIIIIAAYGKEYAIVPMLYDMRDTGYIYAVESYTAGLPRYFPRIDVTSRSAAFKALPATITEGQLMDGPRGTTRKIWDPTTARAFAQKSVVLTPEIDRRAWCQHVRRLANLDHFHILRLVKFEPEVATVYFPWQKYENLQYQHSIAPLTFGECLALFQQCLSALEYLHAQEPFLAHGNIRPENILITSRSNTLDASGLMVQLSDFGILETERPPCVADAIRYKAPEVMVRGEYTPILTPNYPVRALPPGDLWSLGVVMLQVAYNKALTHSMAQDMITYSLQLHQLIRYWCNDELVLIIRQCVHYRPEARGTAQGVLEDLNHCLATRVLRMAGPAFHACARARVDVESGDVGCVRINLTDDIYGSMVADERIFQQGQMRVLEVLNQRQMQEEERRRRHQAWEEEYSQLRIHDPRYMANDVSDSDSFDEDDSSDDGFGEYDENGDIRFHDGGNENGHGHGHGHGGGSCGGNCGGSCGGGSSSNGGNNNNGGGGSSSSGGGGGSSSGGGNGQGGAYVARPGAGRLQSGRRRSAQSGSCSNRGRPRRTMPTIWEQEEEEEEQQQQQQQRQQKQKQKQGDAAGDSAGGAGEEEDGDKVMSSV